MAHRSGGIHQFGISRTGPAGSRRRWNALAKLPGTRVVFEIRVGREQLEQTMKLPSACLILTACTVGWSATAYAQTTQPVVKFPTEIEFKAPLSPGSQTAVLYGDPAKPGVYVQRTKFPAGTKGMPHWHPDEWRTAVVLSGTLYFGIGEQLAPEIRRQIFAVSQKFGSTEKTIFLSFA